MSELEPQPVSAATPASAARLLRRRGSWVLWFSLALTCLLAGVLVLGTRWAMSSPQGSAWLLRGIERLGLGVQVIEPQGAFLGDFSAQQMIVTAGRVQVMIDQPHWQGLRVAYANYHGTWMVLHAKSARASKVTIKLIGPPRSKPATLPRHLHLPVEIQVDSAQVDDLHVPGIPAHPFSKLRAKVHLGAERGTKHRFDDVSGQFEHLLLSGHGHIEALSPMALDVQLHAVQSKATEPLSHTPLPAWAKAMRRGWQAQLRAQGPLAQFDLHAWLQADGQQFSAQAQVEPIAPWALPFLQATTEKLDLSALMPQAPVTALSGHVRIAPINARSGRAQGLQLTSELVNAQPGRWNEQRLPLRSLKINARGLARAQGSFDVQTVELALADAEHDAGTLRGSGHWDPLRFNFKAQLLAVRPGSLDHRLPAMSLSGPISLAGHRPETPAQAQPQFSGTADLTGRMIDFDQAVQFKLSVSGDEEQVELRELKVAAGGAKAEAAGAASRTGKAWQLKAKAALVEFDPRTWLPGTGNAAWAAGPHRLNLHGDLALTVPDAGSASGRYSLIDQLGSLRGVASVQLNQSLLAGEAVAGQIQVRRARTSEPLLATAQLELAGNSIKVSGSMAPHEAAQDQWTIQAKAHSVARLAPILKMLPSLQHSGLLEGLSGALTADTQVSGRWPDLSAQGKAELVTLTAGPIHLSQGQMRWQLGSTASAALDVQADLAQAAWGKHRLGATQLNLKGSTQTHALSVRTELKAQAPAWIHALQDLPAAHSPSTSRTQAMLTAQGSLSGGLLDGQRASATPVMPLAWKGTVQQLDVSNMSSAASPWLQARDVGLELQGGTAPRFVVAAGRAQLLTAGLRWERIEWQPDSGVRGQQLNMQAELEPMAVAPLLQRLQPEFGWRGDLMMGGTVIIKQASEFSADIVIERLSGDLSVTDDSGTQALGLSDLVLSMNAQNGIWNFTQGMAGTHLGVAAGAFVLHTSPQRAWPEAHAPLQGVLEAKVENLGAWGAWVPAGWRLGGQLRTTAGLSGKFGAPEFTGRVQGTGITVRNLLQGVNVAQGEVDITLKGDTARINQLQAKAGAGTVSLSGEAELGSAPRAHLQLSADKFQLLGRVDRRIILSGQGKVMLDRDSPKVEGQFGVDEGLFDLSRADAPSLGSDVVLVHHDEPAPEITAPTESKRRASVKLGIDLGQNLKLKGRGIDTQLQGAVNISTVGGRPHWIGSVRAIDGTYAAYGQKLSIERGEITFTGPPADPRLDIHAMRPNLDVKVGVAISGTALNPRVQLYSDPDMSDIDKLSWLLLGRASDGLGTADTALLQRTLLALLAGDNPSVTDQVLRSIGIDELSVRQSDGEVRETVVSVGKQLSRRWYVGYERGLNATAGTWQLIYRIAQRFTLRANAGSENALDAIWTFKWE